MRMPTTKTLSAAADYSKTYTSTINWVKLIITSFYLIDRNIFCIRSTLKLFFLPHVE